VARSFCRNPRSQNHCVEHLVLWPTIEESAVENSSVTDKRAYRDAFTRLSLDLVGREATSEIDGTTHSTWYLFDPVTRMRGIDDWSGIAHAAYVASDVEASEIARHISFSLQAASLRLRDVSRSYGFQSLHVVRSGTGCGRRFQNIESSTFIWRYTPS
jgi:hypothetical protein